MTPDFIFKFASLKDDNLLILESGYSFHTTAVMMGAKDALANEETSNLRHGWRRPIAI
jgi:hypothetical protein